MLNELLERLIKEAGWAGIYTQWVSPTERESMTVPVTTEQVAKFAELVAAAEREACAMVCEKRASTYKNPPIDGNEFISGYFQEEAELCAFAIRKRSNA